MSTNIYTTRKKSHDEVQELLAFGSRASRREKNKKKHSKKYACRKNKHSKIDF